MCPPLTLTRFHRHDNVTTKLLNVARFAFCVQIATLAETERIHHPLNSTRDGPGEQQRPFCRELSSGSQKQKGQERGRACPLHRNYYSLTMKTDSPRC